MRRISSAAETLAHFFPRVFDLLSDLPWWKQTHPLFPPSSALFSDARGVISTCRVSDCVFMHGGYFFSSFFFFKKGPHVAATPPVFAVKHLHSSSEHIRLHVSVLENTQSWFILYCLLFELALYFIPAAEIFSFLQHQGGIIDWHYEGFQGTLNKGQFICHLARIYIMLTLLILPACRTERRGVDPDSAVMGFLFYERFGTCGCLTCLRPSRTSLILLPRPKVLKKGL